jgi:glycosyltransferase involved in cell wall biosynthesis
MTEPFSRAGGEAVAVASRRPAGSSAAGPATERGRVLCVSYFFPPIGGIGVQRVLKFVTYLPRWGWQPVVVAPGNPGYGLRDESLMAAVAPDLEVHRTRSFEPVKVRQSIGRLVRKVLRRGSRSGSTSQGAVSASGAPRAVWTPGRARATATGLWAGFVRLLFFPDQQVGWAPFAWRSGLDANKGRRFDAVYSSSGPISSHLAAGYVARRARLPWVADFRDPWIGNAFAAPLPLWQRPFQRRLEKWIVNRADRLIFVSDGVAQGYRDRYPQAAGKMRVIPNGYDSADFGPAIREAIAARRSARSRRGAPGQRFRMVYAGAVYGEHELEVFMDGLELLLSRRPELRDRLDVEFVGQVNARNQEVAARYATPERLGGIVRYSGFVPHDEALLRLARADAAFNIIADEPEKWRIPSGKLTEYVGLNLQVIAFVPEGSARELLSELGWGIVADPTPEGVAAGIEKALAAPPPHGPADPDGRYDRVNLTAQLVKALDEAVEVRRPR